jgi:hypothetical protein
MIINFAKKINSMDFNFYEELLNRIASSLYGTKIKFDKKGVFEWSKNTDGSTSHRSINVLHYFKLSEKKKKDINTQKAEPKVSYFNLKNSIYISQISEDDTVDIYSSGGGMVKRYTFKITDSKIQKLAEKVIMIR